ncbi:MAG TPA: hypothetical protein VGC23_00585, partial [Vicinamibacterales bacterium]
ACHEPEDYLLSPSQIDRVLNVTVSATTISADGISRATITAQLDSRTDADKRDVTFTTTAGTLIGGGREGLSITVPADSAGKAVAELRSAITPATAQIEVAAGSIRRASSVAFLALARDEVVDVSASRSTLPADGFSKAVITARLRRPAPLQQRTVTFETSAGILIASGQSSARVLTVTADAAGEAQVELQSEKTVGTARVRVTTLTITHELAIQFAPVDPTQIITVTTERSSAPADGVTPLAVAATVAPGLPAQRRTVTFTTTLGEMIPAAIEADGSNVARTSLVSTTTGTARITATVDGTTAETTVRFNPALPDRVHLSVDAAELRSGESSNLRVTLIRTNGSVSPHLSVTYAARTSTNAAIGSFSAVTLAESSIATATFNLGTTSYQGPLTITATAEGGESTTATVRIVP